MTRVAVIGLDEASFDSTRLMTRGIKGQETL